MHREHISAHQRGQCAVCTTTASLCISTDVMRAQAASQHAQIRAARMRADIQTTANNVMLLWIGRKGKKTVYLSSELSRSSRRINCVEQSMLAVRRVILAACCGLPSIRLLRPSLSSQGPALCPGAGGNGKAGGGSGHGRACPCAMSALSIFSSAAERHSAIRLQLQICIWEACFPPRLIISLLNSGGTCWSTTDPKNWAAWAESNSMYINIGLVMIGELSLSNLPTRRTPFVCNSARHTSFML